MPITNNITPKFNSVIQNSINQNAICNTEQLSLKAFAGIHTTRNNLNSS